MIFFSYFSKQFLSQLITQSLISKNSAQFYFFKNILTSEHVFIIGDKYEYRSLIGKLKNKINTQSTFYFIDLFLNNSKWVNSENINQSKLKEINIDYYFDVEKNFQKKENIDNFLTAETINKWDFDNLIKNLSNGDKPLELKCKAKQNLDVFEKTNEYLNFVKCFEKLVSFSNYIIIYDKYISSQLVFPKGNYIEKNFTFAEAYNDTLDFFSKKILNKSLVKNINCKIICIFDPKHNKFIESVNREKNEKNYEQYSKEFFSNIGKFNGSMHIKDGNYRHNSEDKFAQLFDLLHDRYFLFFDTNNNLLRMINFKNGFDFIKRKSNKTRDYMFTPEKKIAYESVVKNKIDILENEEFDMFRFKNSA